MRESVRHSVSCFTGFFALSLFFGSCSNEIELNVAADPVPVVWCLLNPDVHEQYVRLGRSFLLDPNHPDHPPVTDSTVWDMPVTLYIEELQDGLSLHLYRFNPVAAPAKDTGFFPEGNLRLYKSDFQPVRLATYRLYIHFPDDNRIVTGTTTLPGRPLVYDPLDIPGRKITLQSGVQFTARWAPGKGRGIFQGLFIINYNETLNEEPSVYQAYMRMNPTLGLGSDIEMTDILSGNRFLVEMVKQIPFREGAERSVINVQFKLFKGGEELALMASPDLQSTTISNSLNQYTNLVNGIGIFSSMQQTAVNNLQLSNSTLNELAHSELTHNLGFKDIHGGELNSENDE
ncbi:MAG: DUF4249 family protein [Bacteroidia bacterium]|nr:DUF4249 family protein [Bacteroidia bacterium]